MDYNLILTAQTLVLAPDLRESEPIDGVRVMKNITAKTFLRVTNEQWVLLQLFVKPRSVPAVLGRAIEERLCLPLEEFFELILKAVRANILLEPQVVPPVVKPYPWHSVVRAQTIARPLLILFFAGLIMTLAFRPQLPGSIIDVLGGLVVLSAALSLGSFVVGCIIRGAEGDVYEPRWQWLAFPPRFEVDQSDAVILSSTAQQAIAMAQPAMLATATGLIAWHRPDWNLLPLIGLVVTLRPIFGGQIASLFRLGKGHGLSDAEHNYIFPPNLQPTARWKLLRRALSHPETWVKMAYGVVWTLAIIYLAGRLTDTPPWTLAFWKVNGVRVATGIGGSLLALGAGYLGWELFHYARGRAHHRRRALRLWYARWFDGKKLELDEGTRIKVTANSPLFRALPPPDRQSLARLMRPVHYGVWRWLPEFGGQPQLVGLIVSGSVGLYRMLPSGRSMRVQVLSEGDMIGLHDIADPQQPDYRVRTLTPVTLLTLDRAEVAEGVTQRIPRTALTHIVLKLPFLRRISLCRNWHTQAIERFAQLSSIMDCAPHAAIVSEGEVNSHFYVLFEQEAVVTRGGKRIAVVRAGEFFGEIGLLQNSASIAEITARQGTRCLSIPRQDFLRFVTHNHMVALELERVSSKRLGRPIFPLIGGNFRTI